MTARWAQLVSAVVSAANTRDEDPARPGIELGRFELLDWLGGGGMGVVFRARDTEFGREVALKLWKLPGEEAEDAVLHEAQCLAKLSHPNVVAFYETGKVGDDVFLTMEFVRGMDGREWLQYVGSWREVVDFYLAAGRGLAAAHAVGLEHSDFKPENILLGKDHRVRVADFGVARALRDHISLEDDAVSAEESGGLGTLCYMAPERLQGRRGDARSDQFSFCVALWECLYGARPFSGKTPAALLESIDAGDRQTGVAVLRIPWRLRQVVAKGLSVKPDDRWPDLPTLLDVITRVRHQRQRRVRRLSSAAIGVGFAVGGTLAMAAIIARRTPPREEPSARTPTKADDDNSLPSEQGVADDVLIAKVVTDVAARIEANRLDDAHTRWLAAWDAAWRTDVTLESQSLEIAHAFVGEALRFEHDDPDRAIVAARHATTVASYARPYFPAKGVPASEIADILGTSVRLTSLVNRLLADFTRLSNSTAAGACLCGEHLDYPGLEACRLAHRSIGSFEHACLSSAIWGDEDATDDDADQDVGRYLGCAVPALEAHQVCLGTVSCDPRLVAGCASEHQRGLAACSKLSAITHQQFTNCVK